MPTGICQEKVRIGDLHSQYVSTLNMVAIALGNTRSIPFMKNVLHMAAECTLTAATMYCTVQQWLFWFKNKLFKLVTSDYVLASLWHDKKQMNTLKYYICRTMLCKHEWQTVKLCYMYDMITLLLKAWLSTTRSTQNISKRMNSSEH